MFIILSLFISCQSNKKQEADNTSVNISIPNVDNNIEGSASHSLPSSVDKSLDRFFMLNQASRMLPSELYPYHNNGKIYAIYKDLDDDGYSDLIIMAIQAKSWSESNRANLGNIDRLYQQANKRKAYIYTFYQHSGRVILGDVIPMGEYQVFGQFVAYSLAQSDVPFLLVATFPNIEKDEVKATVWKKERRQSLSLFKDKQRDFFISQVNNNELLDIVQIRKGFEEGLGYETFLSWEEWDGSEFVEKASIPLLRSLREYLKQLEIVIYRKDWKYLLSNMVDVNQLNKLKAKGFTEDEIIQKLFKADNDSLYWNFNPRTVNLPEPLENPFSINSHQIYTLSFRVLTDDNGEYFFKASISLTSNPFGDRKFKLIFD
ncbi:hypothetical protein [Spirochaeta cellobiosiphila]|uniref:hypothetical protein n=1 Tax=Spirochaeta cellobiosiphila TaxID=504483 RepID=UPI0012ECA3C4|nr:hypothetical protein [Spirochaeta cellobiosiphila]